LLRKTFSVIMLVLLLANMLAVTSNIRLIKAELTTIRVPEDFPTIQEAINAATPGNIIFVKAGIYRENVIVNKAVSLVGEDPATTIIDGGGVGTVVNITADNVRLTGFTIQNSSLEFGFYAGVYLRKAHYCNISENIIKTNGQIGIYLLGSSYNIISRNNITHNGNGIWLTAIQEGYFVDFTLYNIIANNNITSNYYSLNLVYSSYNNVSGNNIAKSQYGVWIEDSVDNTFLENSIVENGFYGVYLTGYKSANNRFYHNSFINNSRHVYSDGCVSVWDNGYPYGGNYWSDYKGVDEKSGPNQDKPGSDGIGDTPYIIDSNNVDHYPLMNPYEQQIMGPPGTYVWIYWKRDNNYNFDVDLNVTDAPDVVGSGQVIFWAHQFGFVNGSGGYLGLQIVGSQKKVIFSIWDAITGEPGNPFQEGDGHGWQIIINYDWKLNRKYRLRIWELNVEQNGDEWWLAAVYDYASGVDTIIGKILVPAAWGWLSNTSVTWVEYAGYDSYVPRNIPYTRAVFSNLYARNPVENSGPDKLYVAYGTKPANNSDVDYYGCYTYALEAGDDVVRDTPEGWLSEGFPYFEIEASPSSQMVSPGCSVTFTISIKSFNGFNRQVSLTGYAQSGITASFNPETLTPPPNGVAQSVLTIVTAKSLATGNYSVSVRAEEVGGQVQWVTVELTVVAPKVISFDVLYEDVTYTVVMEVSPSAYAKLLQGAENFRKASYPHFNESLFAQAYYLSCYIEAPDMYPVYNVTIYQNGLVVADRYLKVAIVDGLIKYCYMLIWCAWPEMLNQFKMQGLGWLKIYNNNRFIVGVSNGLSQITYWATLIGPLIDSIKTMFGGSTSEAVEGGVSLFLSVIGGYNSLKEQYGAEKADAITNLLVENGYVYGRDYNPMRLYQRFVDNPQETVQTLKTIGEQVLNLEFDSNAQATLTDFIDEIKSGVVGDFATGAAIGLLAYFGSGLTAKTCQLIGLSKTFESFLGGTLPLSLASAIHQAYITPMAEALNAAWESAGQASDTYLALYMYGGLVAYPIEDKFNLTEAQIFASTYGFACVTEFRYYMYSHFYRSRQLFVPESELNMLKDNAQTMFNRAVNWAGLLSKIQDLSKALVSEDDPPNDYTTLTVQAINNVMDMPQPIPPINIFPELPANLSGFSLISEPTPNITLSSETNIFIVKNGRWWSNFSYSIYVDDPYGRLYLIIFDPPQQTYKVTVQNETSFYLKNFKPENETITIKEAGSITGTEIHFNVTNSSVDPESVIPEFPPVIFLPLLMFFAMLAHIFAKKRKKG